MEIQTSKKKGGFLWWLLWIIIAIGSFILSAIFWTWFLTTVLGEIKGTPLTILWVASVFGSWLVTMVPIVRAKERYWNRLSEEDETNVIWWIGWIALTIATFFISAGFWTWFFAKEGTSIQAPGSAEKWVFAVFGTWMIALLPLIVVMYRKVDRAYERARQRREKANSETRPRAKTIYIERSERLLNESLAEKLKKLTPTLKKGRWSGHLMNVVLKDGRKFENIFIVNRSEILGIYGRQTLPFKANEIADLEPVAFENLIDFSEENWLRLDGRN